MCTVFPLQDQSTRYRYDPSVSDDISSHAQCCWFSKLIYFLEKFPWSEDQIFGQMWTRKQSLSSQVDPFNWTASDYSSSRKCFRTYLLMVFPRKSGTPCQLNLLLPLGINYSAFLSQVWFRRTAWVVYVCVYNFNSRKCFLTLLIFDNASKRAFIVRSAANLNLLFLWR